MKTSTSAVAFVLTLALSASCASGGAPAGDGPTAPGQPVTEAQGPPSPSGARTEGPPQPAPTVPGVQSSPPPAWVQTQDAAVWLAFSSYCWGGTCLDARPVEQRTDVPEITLRARETVRFHLGFTPSTLELVVGDRTYQLEPGATSEWAARGSGGLARLVAQGEQGSADYVAHIVVR